MRYFNTTLRKLVKQSDLSVYRLVEITGMDDKYLRNLLNGKRSNPSPKTIVRLREALTSNPAKVAEHPDLANAGILMLQALLRDAAAEL